MTPEKESFLLSLDYIGKDSDGRYLFRPKEGIEQLFSGDLSYYREWWLAQRRYSPIPAIPQTGEV